ncbi:hypothetical protein [Nocardioides aurantiacus]|uniref:hypothetical protein n=1 Tax=Nocardioides aurantiacus TaxID=86796 RepID=UPI00403FA20B
MLLVSAVRALRARRRAAIGLPRWFTPLTAAGLGVVMTGADLPNAFPYVIAVERLLDASVGTGTALLVLALYAVVYCVPCLVLLALGLRHSDRVTGWLRRLHDRFGSEATMPANPWKALVLLVLAVAVGAVTVVA